MSSDQSVQKIRPLVYGFVARRAITIRRYPLNFLGTILTFFVVFLLLFLGGRSFAPTAIGDSLDAIIVGYFLFTIVLSTFFSLSGTIRSEAQYGTLEQLYVSPFSFPVVMFVAVISSVVLSLAVGITILSVVILATGENLYIDLITIVPILLLTLFHSIGISFLLAGFSLIYKRIQSLFQLVQFLFLGLIALALTGRTWAEVLPVGIGAVMLKDAMSDGVRLWEFSVVDHLTLVVTATAYMMIGYSVFHVAQHIARQRGLLDDY